LASKYALRIVIFIRKSVFAGCCFVPLNVLAQKFEISVGFRVSCLPVKFLSPSLFWKAIFLGQVSLPNKQEKKIHFSIFRLVSCSSHLR